MYERFQGTKEFVKDCKQKAEVENKIRFR